MKAAVWYDVKDLRVEDKEVPAPKAGQVKIRVAWSGICGSDLHEYVAGPIIIPRDQKDPLTGVQAPLTMGHEFSGVVEEVGAGVENLTVGDKVAVNPLIVSGEAKDTLTDMYRGFAFVGLNSDGGFADYVVVDEEQAVKLDKNMSLEHAALMEPTAVALQAIRESRFEFGESVAIFGAGPIGLLTILAARAAGAKEIYAFDLSPERLEKAKEVGATEAINSGEVDPVKYILDKFPDGIDRSFEVAGVEQTFHQAIEVTRPRGTMTVISIYEQPVEFHPMSLTTSGVHVLSSLAYEPDIFEITAQMMSSGQIDPSPIITSHIELDEIVDKGFNVLLNDKSQAKILVKLSGEK